MSKRKLEILRHVSKLMLDYSDNQITTALLAKSVGVTESALYRHYKNKNEMFYELFRFVEELLLNNLLKIAEDSKLPLNKAIYKMLLEVVQFVQQNPGFSRLFMGNLSSVELVTKSKDLNLQLTQCFRVRLYREEQASKGSLQGLDQTISLFIYGIITRYFLSGFKTDMTKQLKLNWRLIELGLNEVK